MELFLKNFSDMTIYQFIIWFFVYSFLGWCMECCVIRKELGYWENRGFAKLPFCVIYGFGCTIAFALFAPIDHNPVLLFLTGAVGATIFEYMVGITMIRLFGELWWNYDHKKYNYKGIICLDSTIGWGVIAVLLFMLINDKIKYMVKLIDPKIAVPLSCVLVTAYLVDFSTHFYFSLVNNRKSGNTGRQEEKLLNENAD